MAAVAFSIVAKRHGVVTAWIERLEERDGGVWEEVEIRCAKVATGGEIYSNFLLHETVEGKLKAKGYSEVDFVYIDQRALDKGNVGGDKELPPMWFGSEWEKRFHDTDDED